MGSKKLKKCKSCGVEVAKSAKTCPQCGAKLKGSKLILIGIIALIVLAVVIASSGGSSEPKTADTKNEFSVGEAAELKGVKVTLVGVTESVGSTYNKPTEGNVFVLCEFEIANNSKKEINVSSLMSFEAYCDDYTCTFSLSALMEKGDKNQLDGTVAPGKKFIGVIGYEVPADWKELEVVFTPDFTSSKTLTFIVSNE